DGIRKSLGDESYTLRFSPRKPTSTWSAINIRRVAELQKMGLMQPAGRKAFEQRKDAKSAIYSYERVATAKLSPAQEKKFRSRKPAWAFFQAQPPGYRKRATHWVISAKKEETSVKRAGNTDQGIRTPASPWHPVKKEVVRRSALANLKSPEY